MNATRLGVRALAAFALILGGCGSSSGPDVGGAPATDQATLFRAVNLERAFAHVRSSLGGDRVRSVKIEPRAVKVEASSRVVVADVSQVESNSSPGAIPLGQFSFGIVSPRVAQQIANAVEAKERIAQTGIAYLLATEDPDPGAKPYWGVYLRGGQFHYEADIDGRHLRRIG